MLVLVTPIRMSILAMRISKYSCFVHCFFVCVPCYWLDSNSGGRSIRDFRILSNRQQVLTKDSAGDVALWDVLHVRKKSIKIITCTYSCVVVCI